jgi:hypothetical protein
MEGEGGGSFWGFPLTWSRVKIRRTRTPVTLIPHGQERVEKQTLMLDKNFNTRKKIMYITKLQNPRLLYKRNKYIAHFSNPIVPVFNFRIKFLSFTHVFWTVNVILSKNVFYKKCSESFD